MAPTRGYARISYEPCIYNQAPQPTAPNRGGVLDLKYLRTPCKDGEPAGRPNVVDFRGR